LQKITHFPSYIYIYIYKFKKVKLTLCSINCASRHEDVSGIGGIALSYLTSALDGVEWSDSRPAPLAPGKEPPGTHWIGAWVGLRAGLNAMEKRKTLPLKIVEHRPSSP
jgi:hypothetical protein